MSYTTKRKAEDVDHHGFYINDRPTLKRRGTSASQIHLPRQDNISNYNEATSELHTRHGRSHSRASPHSGDHPHNNAFENATHLPTPPLDQDEFMNDIGDFSSIPPHTHHRTPHQEDQTAPLHSHIAHFTSTLHTLLHALNLDPLPSPSPPTPQTFLTHSRTTLLHLHTHLTTLQALTLTQLKLRNEIAATLRGGGGGGGGYENAPILDSLDLALRGLDARMMGLMAGVQALEAQRSEIEAAMASWEGREMATEQEQEEEEDQASTGCAPRAGREVAML